MKASFARSCLVLLVTLIVMLLLSYRTSSPAASSLPTPSREVHVIVVPQHIGDTKHTYNYTEQVYDDVRTSTVPVREWVEDGVFVRQFGETKDNFVYAEFADGRIQFDFGSTLLSSRPLYPITAGEERKYFTVDGKEVTLFAEADETIVIGNEKYHCLRFHTNLAMQDGNIVELFWWLTSDRRLIRYTREMAEVFALRWDIQNNSTTPEAFVSE